MKKDYSPEKILIIIALVLFAGITFYNAFFIPEVSVPTIIYVDKDNSESENSQSTDSSSDSSSSSSSNSSKTNINTATESELSSNLPGIGTVLAKKIVEYRQYNGNFASIEEIKNVSGIGDKLFESIKDLICV
ncbi:MAG: hypothetical protein RUMPE_01241 [Eubacteriales bacterium SKADARSKE-1]|nr:hypothetical protein [Eubacteriales bacterium SKADARSKE-1]